MVALKRVNGALVRVSAGWSGSMTNGGHWSGSMGVLKRVNGHQWGVLKRVNGCWSGSMGVLKRVNGGNGQCQWALVSIAQGY